MYNDDVNTKNWNDYFIEGTNVLKNKLGITDNETLNRAEADITFQRLVELHVKPIDMNFDETHLKMIHYYLFNDIYSFAGKYRTAYMKKNYSNFAPVDQIESDLKEIFEFMNDEIKKVYSKHDFARVLADVYVRLLDVHPFREGNGRTIREFIREYANAKSKELPFGEIHFSWKNVDADAINSIIDKSMFFHSLVEVEFLKAFEPVDKSLRHIK